MFMVLMDNCLNLIPTHQNFYPLLRFIVMKFDLKCRNLTLLASWSKCMKLFLNMFSPTGKREGNKGYGLNLFSPTKKKIRY